MTAEPPSARPAGISRAARVAADELAAFARLFRERREAERLPGGKRSEANLREMERLAPAVQRHLEFVDRSWLHASGDGGRPFALVHLIAFGNREDYEALAERAQAQLDGAEASYRSGHVDPTRARRRRRRRRRSFLQRHFRSRAARLGTALLLAAVVYTLILQSCVAWGAEYRPWWFTAVPGYQARMF